jgi:hypothetical protein
VRAASGRLKLDVRLFKAFVLEERNLSEISDGQDED